MKKRLIYIFIFAVLLSTAWARAPFGDGLTLNYAYAVSPASGDEEQTGEEEAEEAETEEVPEQNKPYLPEMPQLPDEYKVLETYETSWPDCMFYDIQYNKYDVFPHYVVNLSYTKRKIYEEPDTEAEYYGKLKYAYKLQAVALIEDEDDQQWYVVVYENDDQVVLGYVLERKVAKREFQIESMNKYLQNVSGFHELGHIVYVENYRYKNGSPPYMPNRSYYDDYGNRRGQAIGGYFDSSLEGEFRYIPDGTIGIIEQIIEVTVVPESVIAADNKGILVSRDEFAQFLDETDKEPDEAEETDIVEKYNEETQVQAVKLYIPSFGTSVWVNEKYLNEDEDAPDVLNQAVIVDRLNQNIAVFEYDGQWKAISFSYSSTGKVGEFSLPTPLGYYMAVDRKPKFDYVEDGTTTIVGFAPYTIRFSAGGYLHGVPMNYGFNETGGRVSPTSYVEYLASIGTVPKSHMCVRNYTSHAKFMYDWVDISNCTVIIIE